MKNKFIILVFSFFATVSCMKKETKTTHNGFIINGFANNYKSKEINLIDKNGKVIAKAKIKKDTFSIKGKIEKPDLYFLQIKKHVNKFPIVLENLNYHTLIDDTDAKTLGGKLHNNLAKYRTKKQQFSNEKANYYRLFSIRKIGLTPYLKIVDSINKIEKKELISFITKNQNNILSSIIIKETPFSSKSAKKLQNKLKNKSLIAKFDEIIKKAKTNEELEKILNRKPAKLFSAVNLEGGKTSLQSVIKGKKAVLIDFWASWCGPCREMSPKIKALYKKYKFKGFDIISVSEDRSVNEWKNGIYEDELYDWHHVYDDYNRISSLYGVTALPHMVLLDSNGKIVENKIRYNDLEKYLKNNLE